METVGSLLLFGGVVLMLVVAESLFWFGLVGFALLTVVYAAKGVRLLRAGFRRRARSG
ncbi:hypothetical protein ACFWVF_19570 [Streptomyces sp. NPDC058659]|uniref:hypothetical protein n=1 Tax=unclassified Streptomyces TaxID=2593676 RepID=UPI0036595137